MRSIVCQLAVVKIRVEDKMTEFDNYAEQVIQNNPQGHQRDKPFRYDQIMWYCYIWELHTHPVCLATCFIHERSTVLRCRIVRMSFSLYL